MDELEYFEDILLTSLPPSSRVVIGADCEVSIGVGDDAPVARRFSDLLGPVAWAARGFKGQVLRAMLARHRLRAATALEAIEEEHAWTRIDCTRKDIDPQLSQLDYMFTTYQHARAQVFTWVDPIPCPSDHRPHLMTVLTRQLERLERLHSIQAHRLPADDTVEERVEQEGETQKCPLLRCHVPRTLIPSFFLVSPRLRPPRPDSQNGA